MSNTFFSISDYACGYDSFQLNDINFDLRKGSFTGIIGPNGSGKTTLFRGIAQTLPALNGRISINDEVIESLSLRERAKRIAIVNQFVSDTQIRVMDYVLMGRIPYTSRFQFFESKADKELAEHYMSLTGILQDKNKWLDELSGGEQQRAAIARALTQQPDLLLLDEPTAHLDIAYQVKILDLLQKLNSELELTVLMVIHDLNLASEYCDQLILLNNGKITTKGTPGEVLSFETIEKVYQTPVITRINPYSGKPVVFLISEKMLRERNSNGNPLER
jgi:iron complex transport system ATP-binding protein